MRIIMKHKRAEQVEKTGAGCRIAAIVYKNVFKSLTISLL